MTNKSDKSDSQSSISPGFAFSAGSSIDMPNGSAGEGTTTIESAEDRVTIQGGFVITRDLRGLELAQALLTLAQGAVGVLKRDQAAGSLPKVLTLDQPTLRDNPFA